MLAMRPIGLRLRHGVDALGNAIGESLAAEAQPKVPGPVSAEERANILKMFEDGPGSNVPSGYYLSRAQEERLRSGETVTDAGAPLGEGPYALASNKVEQVIKFGEDVALQGSYLNDVRFHPDGRTAFITDSGARGSILVVDLVKGTGHSRLDGHPSTQPDKGVEVTVEGRKLVRPDGRALQVAVDGLALSNDGKTLYFQPLTGRTLYRIPTELLLSDDPEAAGQKVEKAGASCVADGLLMTRDDRLLITSPEDSSIKLWEGDRARTLVQDANLRWPDSMAEAPDGSIYVTASRIQDSAWFNKDAPAALPTKLYRMLKT